jgi:apolipoprotein D and lipocalin family protein
MDRALMLPYRRCRSQPAVIVPYVLPSQLPRNPRIQTTMKRIALIACFAWTLAGAQPAAAPSTVQQHGPLTTIAALDVPRYMGTWFEIAKYPNWFQRKCVSDTRADYQLQASGTVQVTNRCRRENGEMEQAVGEARQLGPATSPKLQVRFAPAWLSLLPFVWGDYWVIDLDADYRLVAVSEPKREYLWVLSRSPTVGAEEYQALLLRLKAQGFDLDRLERTRQAVN